MVDRSIHRRAWKTFYKAGSTSSSSSSERVAFRSFARSLARGGDDDDDDGDAIVVVRVVERSRFIAGFLGRVFVGGRGGADADVDDDDVDAVVFRRRGCGDGVDVIENVVVVVESVVVVVVVVESVVVDEKRGRFGAKEKGGVGRDGERGDADPRTLGAAIEGVPKDWRAKPRV